MCTQEAGISFFTRCTAEMSEMDIVDDISTKIVPSAKDTLPWVEKYRPDSLDELIAHEEIISILNKLIESNKLPHLLFHGPPGTGTLHPSPHLLLHSNDSSIPYNEVLSVTTQQITTSMRMRII